MGAAPKIIIDKLRKANKRVKDAVSIAKSKWHSHLASMISDMPTTPKTAWRAAREISDGVNSHHVKPKRMSMTLPDGSKSSNNKQIKLPSTENPSKHSKRGN